MPGPLIIVFRVAVYLKMTLILPAYNSTRRGYRRSSILGMVSGMLSSSGVPSVSGVASEVPSTSGVVSGMP